MRDRQTDRQTQKDNTGTGSVVQKLPQGTDSNEYAIHI